MSDSDINYLSDARKFVMDNKNEGVICPCCNRFVKIYHRNINSSMAYVLISMYKTKNDDYFHVEKYLKKINIPTSMRGDFHKLRFWNVIEKKAEKRKDGSNRNGYYRITDIGKDFVNRKILLPKTIYLESNKLIGSSDDMISIDEALTNKFNYNDLMNNII